MKTFETITRNAVSAASTNSKFRYLSHQRIEKIMPPDELEAFCSFQKRDIVPQRFPDMPETCRLDGQAVIMRYYPNSCNMLFFLKNGGNFQEVFQCLKAQLAVLWMFGVHGNLHADNILLARKFENNIVFPYILFTGLRSGFSKKTNNDDKNTLICSLRRSGFNKEADYCMRNI